MDYHWIWIGQQHADRLTTTTPLALYVGCLFTLQSSRRNTYEGLLPGTPILQRLTTDDTHVVLCTCITDFTFSKYFLAIVVWVGHTLCVLLYSTWSFNKFIKQSPNTNISTRNKNQNNTDITLNQLQLSWFTSSLQSWVLLSATQYYVKWNANIHTRVVRGCDVMVLKIEPRPESRAFIDRDDTHEVVGGENSRKVMIHKCGLF